MRLLPLYVRLALGEFAGAFRVGADGRALHAYSFQTFTVGQVLAATKMNQVEVNIRDQAHGIAGVNALARFAVFTASGSFTCPLTGNCLVVRKGDGGGGGGGGGAGSTSGTKGGPGGGGGEGELRVEVVAKSLNDVLSIAINAGGAGGAGGASTGTDGAQGSAGGTTQVTGLTDSAGGVGGSTGLGATLAVTVSTNASASGEDGVGPGGGQGGTGVGGGLAGVGGGNATGNAGAGGGGGSGSGGGHAAARGSRWRHGLLVFRRAALLRPVGLHRRARHRQARHGPWSHPILYVGHGETLDVGHAVRRPLDGRRQGRACDRRRGGGPRAHAALRALEPADRHRAFVRHQLLLQGAPVTLRAMAPVLLWTLLVLLALPSMVGSTQADGR